MIAKANDCTRAFEEMYSDCNKAKSAALHIRWACQIDADQEMDLFSFNRRRGRDHVCAEFRFHTLANKWKEDTMFSSSIDQIESNQSYLEIIKLGQMVLPMILADLKSDDASLWFGALEAISGENPVPQNHRGFITDMTNDWLSWGRTKGLVK